MSKPNHASIDGNTGKLYDFSKQTSQDEIEEILRTVAFSTKMQTGMNLDGLAIKNAIAKINKLLIEARIDEVKKFKLNRSHNKGELELINNRLNQLEASLNKEEE